MLEAEVHHLLREFLRERGTPSWSHHLTMARIVSRALRLRRSALIQTGSSVRRYCLSYLTPALLSDSPLLLVATPALQQQLLAVEIPQLQQWLQVDKKIQTGEQALAGKDFSGLTLISPPAWLGERLASKNRFSPGIPTLIDGADDLEDWARDLLAARIEPQDWDELIRLYPQRAESVRDVRVQLTKAIFHRPPSPYNCYLLEKAERESLQQLLESLAAESLLTPVLNRFWQCWQQSGQMSWAALVREKGQFTLHIAPTAVASALRPLWQQQPVVLIGGFLDKDKEAAVYRQQLGLGEMLCLKFSPSRQSECIQLYLPEGLPLPNTPQFQRVVMEQLLTLFSSYRHPSFRGGLGGVVLVDDIPLKGLVGARLAAEFGSRVQVERTALPQDGILVCGWQFWHAHQVGFPTPQLLAIATLPIPSLENPLVAGRVAYYKRQHQDWFRCYLLPAALREIQRAVMPLRESQGVVALLDSRVNSRSYGSEILNVLSPYARINYLEASWFEGEN